MGVLGLLLKHLLPPTWIRGFFRDAEVVPAIASGFLVMWLILATSGWWLYQEAQAYLTADMQRTATYEQKIAANTKALECNRSERIIAAKSREITNLERLIDRASDAAEKRELEAQLIELNRALLLVNRTYERDCL